MSIRKQYNFIRIFQAEISNTLALDEAGGIRKFLILLYYFGTIFSNTRRGVLRGEIGRKWII